MSDLAVVGGFLSVGVLAVLSTRHRVENQPAPPPATPRRPRSSSANLRINTGRSRSLSNAEPPKRVFVSGCFDLLHSGHVAFFKQASLHGDLYVSVGNDANIRQLKHHDPMFPEDERVYMVQAIRYVHKAFVAKGMGHDQERDLRACKADVFFVNEDGDRPEKRAVCEALGVQYVVEARVPDAGLTPRSSTNIKNSPQAQGAH